MSQSNYNCDKCKSYCCAYPIIQIKKDDVRRLAKHLGLTKDGVRKEYTELESPRVRKLCMTTDPVIKSKSCVFLDKKNRKCTVYEGRPEICRNHPDDRCEWYDRHQIETAMAADGKKVILLRELPWTIDSDYPLYDEKRVTKLLESYVANNGIIKD